VSVDSSVIVTFSEPMKSSAITTATFSVSNGTDNIAGTVTYDGTTGAFNPSENLGYNTVYTASVTTAAKDLAGNPLENDYTWSFTTGPRPDTTPPTVSSTSPENGASAVSVDSSVIVTFSEPMKSSAITTATFSVSNGTDNIAGTVTYDGTTGAFNSSENLGYNTVYTASVTTAAKDLAGNPLENDYIWSFTTGPEPDTTFPTVTSTSPENKETDISVDTAVTVTFSEPMKSSTVTTATFFVNNMMKNIAGTVTYDGTTGTFTPAENLAYNTDYIATVTTAAKDLAGNPLVNSYVWSFTTGPEPDITPPTVSSTSPENKETNVSVDAAVTATFSESMKSSTITTASFFISNQAGNTTGTVVYNGTTATFTPAENFAYNTTYTAMIANTAKDLAGNPLKADYAWTFITGPEPDTIQPGVSSTTPENKAVNVPVGTGITATFSEPMKSSTITTATFFVNNGINNITGTVTYDGTTGTFRPSENLAYNTTYIATITSAAKDLAGNPMKTDYVWSFITGSEPDTTSPTVSSTTPANTSTDADVDTAITATFSEPMKSSTITTATFFVNDGINNITGTVTYDGTTGTFTPAENFDYDTIYTAVITSDAMDLSGNSLESDYEWSFTTGSKPDTTRPAITLTSPGDKSVDVSVDTAVSATFSESMKSSTITTATFSVTDGTDIIPGTVTYDGTTGTFTPAENFAYNTTYSGMITEDAKDLAGNNLEEKYIWSFTTGSEPDTVLPTISFINPGNDSDDVPVDTLVTVTFSEPMKSSSITTATFFLSIGTKKIPGTVSYSNAVARFTPAIPLNYNTLYRAAVSTEARDMAGNPLQFEYTWSFTTGINPDNTRPEIVSTVPADNETGVSPNSVVIVSFSEIMDAETISTDTFIVSNGSENITGTVEYNGNSATFIPEISLDYDTDYIVVITTGVTDPAGNSLESEKTWSFTTKAEPDTTAPRIISTVPGDKETKVAVEIVITAVFSEPMNPSTITTGTFIVSDGSDNIAGNVTYNDVTATFKPSENLDYNTFYTVSVTTGAADMAGNPLKSENTWSFTTTSEPDTTAPRVISNIPARAETGVSADSVITVTFSEPVDAETLTAETFFAYGGSDYVAGHISYNGVVAILTPSSSLDFDTICTVTVSADIKDLAGNPLEPEYIWSFTTEKAPVYTITPLPGENGNISPSAQITAEPGENITLAFIPDAGYEVDTVMLDDEKVALTILNKYTIINITKDYDVYVTFKKSVAEETKAVIEPGTMKMISFVHQPFDPSPESVFDEVGNYDTNIFRIGTYDPAKDYGGYKEYSKDLETIEPGRAYWFYARNGLDIKFSGTPVGRDYDIEKRLLYNPDSKTGWNMTGCPNDAEYEWKDIQVLQYNEDGTRIIKGPVSVFSDDNDMVDTKLWEWKDGSYNYDYDVLRMKVNEGYWVKAKKENVYLRFPRAAQKEPSNSETVAAQIRFQGKKWAGDAWKGIKTFFVPGLAIADSGNSPPQPIGYSDPASQVDDGGGGCFIKTCGVQ
ncbi:MAG: Ig-like domain-containing protein, partial [Desulfobacterales bacterium]|nr:Ig-like domain-containing protein [Desulfobacterales bacterium]